MLNLRLRPVLVFLKGILLALLATTAARAASLGNYQSHLVATNPARIEITDTLGNRLRLRAYGDNMIRVQAVGALAAFSPDDRYLMVENHALGGSLSILGNSTASMLIANGDIRLTISKNPLRLAYADAAGVPLLADSDGIDLDPVTLRYVFTPDAAEDFIGYGQKRLSLQDTFQLAGRTERRNYGEDGYPGRGAQGVLIVPFYMSNKGYGFYAHTTYTHEGRFNNAGDYSFRVELKNFSPPEADYFFIYGPEPAAILDHYTRLTGRPRMPRKAIFGIHLSDNEPSQPTINQSWWQTKVQAHHDAGFPLDHLVYDNDWRAASPLTGGAIGQWGGSQFAFELTRYPDPASFRTWYDARGLMLTLDLNLNNCNDSAGWLPSYNIPPYNATNTSVSDTSDPDYSNPATRAWLWKLFWDKAFNPALGYPGDAIWLDESDGIYRPDGQLLANGRPWHEMKNYYFFLTAQAAVAEGWDNAEGGATPGIGEAKRPWVWIRGGSPGMQRYATHWTGDIDFTEPFYRGSIVGMQASGLAGYPFYNHDAGGFGTNNSSSDPLAKIPGPNDVYYAEWGMGLGSFSPIWRPHGYNNPRWPLHRNTASQDAFRLYGTMRYEMMPYIYSLAHQANESGLPMSRPMALVYPDEPAAWLSAQDLQYHWGHAFLVVPPLHLDGASESRTAWMPPAAKWYDYWTDFPVIAPSPGGFHTFNTTPRQLPLFVKAGSIIPRNDFAVTTKALSDAKLTLDVYTGASGAYELIEDDGITERFRTRGEERRTAFTYTEAATPAPATGTLQIAAATGTYVGASANRSYIVRLRGLTAAPLQVTINGSPITVQAAPLPAGDTTVAAWDATARHALVRLSSRAATAAASVAFTFPDTPSAPSALSATTVSSSQIQLAWTDNSANETGFTLFRKIGANGIYAQLATVAAGVTSYADTGLADETAYFYRVAATNVDGNSDYAPEASATTLSIPPLAPFGLATTTLALDTIRLGWTDNSYNETGFRIERSLSSGSGFVVIATVGSGVTTFDDTGRPASSTYFYRIAATNSVGASPYSAVVSGTTVPPSPPAVPTGLTATVGIGTQINLTWTDASNNELGFKLQRKTGAGGTYAQIAALPAGTTSYSDVGLAGNTTYFYRIVSTNLGGDSAFSTQTSATTPVIGTVTMTGGDGFQATSFNAIGKWSNAQAPSAANDYVTNGNTLRTPHDSAGHLTFAGNSLTLSTNGGILLKGLNNTSITVGALKLNGGRLRNGTADAVQIVYGNIQVLANSILDPNSSGRVIALAAPLAGSGNLTLDGSEGNGGIVRLVVDNPAYTGNWSIPAVTNRQSTLQVGDGGTAGTLGSGTVTNNVALIFNRSDAYTVANPISGTGTVSITGGGTLTLLGNHTYTGATALSGAKLFVNGTLGNTTVTVNFGSVLGGTGTLAGAVSVFGDFAPGANGIGTLTVNNAVTLSGGSTFELNTASSPAHDRLVASGALNVAGSLVVLNTGPALVAGNTFALFNKAPVGNFATVTLPALSPGLLWQNTLAANGSLSVAVAPVGPATAPTPASAATGLATTPTPALAWTAGANSLAHRVYFGMDSAVVAAATPATAGIYQGELPAGTTSFTIAAPLTASTAYFWRIDAVGSGATVASGAVWSFTTAASPSYLTWVAEQNLTSGVNDSVTADPDADGLSNLLEYVLGGTALTQDPTLNPTIALSGGDVVYAFNRTDRSEADTSLLVRYATTLQTGTVWTEVEIGAASGTSGVASVIVEENAAASDAVQVSIPRGASPTLFVRLSATRP